MGRPIGSLNRQKPFADALRMEICAGMTPAACAQSPKN
jgi:hypothetical protein